MDEPGERTSSWINELEDSRKVNGIKSSETIGEIRLDATCASITLRKLNKVR